MLAASMNRAIASEPKKTRSLGGLRQLIQMLQYPPYGLPGRFRDSWSPIDATPLCQFPEYPALYRAAVDLNLWKPGMPTLEGVDAIADMLRKAPGIDPQQVYQVGLSDVVRFLQEQLKRPAEPTVHADGPEPPHWLWLQNKRVRIGNGRSRLSWQLMSYFWERDSAAYEDLQGPGKPWPDEVTDSAVATAVNRFNLDMPSGFPWLLATKNRYVYRQSRQNPAE